MKTIKTLGVIGGDMRQLYCARSALDDGYAVMLSGFEKYSEPFRIQNSDITDLLSNSDAIILPLPVSKDGTDVFAPYSDKPVNAKTLLSSIGREKPVFCGLEGRLPGECFRDLKCFFYGKREEFAAANAVPTAEGAIELAMSLTDFTICSCHCLVAGYGRIGRVLSSFLKGLGADVTVSARKPGDLEFIKAAGMKAIRTDRLCGKFQLIFNTVPSLVFDRKSLAACAVDSVIIDLASSPGGVDRETADRMKIPVYHALSLPGKVAPETAGKIIKNAVYNIMEEEGI